MTTRWPAVLGACALVACGGVGTTDGATSDGGEDFEDARSVITQPATDSSPPPYDAYTAPVEGGVNACPIALVNYTVGTQCVLDGKGSIACPGQPAASGWSYSCGDEGDAAAMPDPSVGTCRLAGRHHDDIQGLWFTTTVCDMPACTRASQFDSSRCGNDAGPTTPGQAQAFACPPDEALAGVAPPNCPRAGSWDDGMSSGPLYCCGP